MSLTTLRKLSLVLVGLLLTTGVVLTSCNHPPQMYSLTIAKVGNGSTTPVVGAHTYDAGTVVSITATADSGWKFEVWSGDASGTSGSINVTVDSDKTVVANFLENNSSLAVSPSITIALDYFGIRNTHWIYQFGGDAHAKIQLIVLVRDEKQNLATLAIPPEGITGFDMDFFQVNALKDNRDPEVFTGSATGSLTFSVAAYNVNKGPITKAQMDVISQWTGVDWSSLKSLIPDKELVGSCWYTWSPSENWGTGSNYTLDDGNLRVWLRVGSGQTMPDPVSQPILKPNVQIASLTLPSDAKVSLGPWVFTNYDTTFTLSNNESFDITVTWQAHSSVTGNYDSGTVTVSGKSQQPVSRSYHYSEAGSRTITITIYYKDEQLDTKSGTMNVAP